MKCFGVITPVYLIQLIIALILALLLFALIIAALPARSHRVYAAGHAASGATTAISPTVITRIYGGGDYDDAVNGIPFAISSGDLAAANPASDTSTIVTEASQCDRNSTPPPSFRVYRSFIEYDTSAITQTLLSARLIFTNYEPFGHDGNGRAVHDLMIHRGTWAATAGITPTIVASTTFQAWQAAALAHIDFGPITVYPYLAELNIDPAAVVTGGTTRLVFRTSAESTIGPLPGSCPTDPEGIGHKFTAPLLAVTYAADASDNIIYLPIITKS